MAKEIRFDRSLYLPEAVEAAAAAYRDHAEISLSTAGDSVIAAITAADEDLDEIAGAFGNHVLYETITRIRQASLQETD
ncbi:MAG TPA: HxsD-like protein [Terriglobales bacterium]|nr:HxsD-like protein [Terriglobales bacterium]